MPLLFFTLLYHFWNVILVNLQMIVVACVILKNKERKTKLNLRFAWRNDDEMVFVRANQLWCRYQPLPPHKIHVIIRALHVSRALQTRNDVFVVVFFLLQQLTNDVHYVRV